MEIDNFAVYAQNSLQEDKVLLRELLHNYLRIISSTLNLRRIKEQRKL